MERKTEMERYYMLMILGKKEWKKFKLPNLGSQYIETYFNFVQKQDELAGQEQDVTGALHIAHLPRWSPYLK
jgi:hypothetical protein